MKFKVIIIATLLLMLFLWGFRSTDHKNAQTAKLSIVSNPKKLKSPDKIVLNGTLITELTHNLEYDFAKTSIRPQYFENLNELAKLLTKNTYVVSLRGHADSIGKYKPNWVLSEKRAVKVKEYLISKGVNKDNILTIPFGSTIPIASNLTSKGRQKNRRVEIKLKEINN